jgi:ethanolamine ammonia-lyase small subunit
MDAKPPAPADPAAPAAAPKSQDPWAGLRAATRARIGLDRAGDTLALRHVLEFQLAHAQARDAVHAPLDLDALAAALAPQAVIRVRSAAPDRLTYLRRPDLGRRLDPACRALLEPGAFDVVFVIGDGLSAIAAQRHAAPLLAACRARLRGRAWPWATISANAWAPGFAPC